MNTPHQPPQRLKLSVSARVLDWTSLSLEAQDLGLAPSASPAEQVALVVMEAPRLACLTVVEPPKASVSSNETGDVWTVTATFDVLDSAALVQAAKDQVATVWLEADLVDSISTPVTALFELCCASNTRISPVDLGFEYVGTQPIVETTAL